MVDAVDEQVLVLVAAKGEVDGLRLVVQLDGPGPLVRVQTFLDLHRALRVAGLGQRWHTSIMACQVLDSVY